MSTSSRSLVWPLVTALVVVAVLYFIASHRASEKPLQQFGSVPPFSLTERSGRTITNHDLAGKIWVADFIFTTCPGPCPIISGNMALLQSRLAGDDRVQLVSFTVDPKDDTPAVLSAYADRLGASPQHWWFLTGPEKPLYDLIRNGFYQSVQDNHGKKLEAGQFVVSHSTYMALVDGQGVMRGFYNGLSAGEQKSLLAGIHQLENE
jgi:protein SCO1/2